MSNDPTREDVRKSIIPKSDQLNADNLLTGPMTVTITGVRRGDKEQPIFVDIEGQQPYKPCKSMRRVLIAAFSDDPKRWIGQRMTLYCDPDVMWAGVRVGGIRISHLSGIDGPKTFLLTQTRGKKAEVVIQPLPPELSPEDQAYIADAKKQIAESPSMEVLDAIGLALKEQAKPIQDAVRGAYKAKKAELKGE